MEKDFSSAEALSAEKFAVVSLALA